MKSFTGIARVFMASMLALGMVACGEDENPVDEGTSQDETTSNLTSEQQKQRLESVAIEASQLFNPEDQRQIIDLADYWENHYGDLGAPTEWDEVFNSPAYIPAHVLRDIRSILRHGDLSTLAWGASNYYYEFSQFTGVFEPGRYSWRKVANSDDIVFRFSNAAGQPVEVTVTASGSNPGVTYEDYDSYTVVAPQRVVTTIVENGVTLVEAVLEANINEQGHTVNVAVSTNVMNIHTEGSLDATDTRITSTGLVTVSGRTLMSYGASMYGQNMATRSVLEEYLMEDRSMTGFTRLVKSGDATVDLLGKVQVKGVLSDSNALFDMADGDYHSWDYDSEQEAHRDCQTACDNINRAMKVQLYFDGTNNVEANVVFEPMYEIDEYYDNQWRWYIHPVFEFADGSTCSIEGYFDNDRFASVEGTWTNLWNRYMRLWR